MVALRSAPIFGRALEKHHANGRAAATMAGLSGGALGGGVPVEATQDTLFGGSVVLFQPLRGAGYRTNVDALLLAGFATGATPASVAFDLGAGVGAVGLA